MTPTERLLTILRFLSGTESRHVVVNADTVRERMGGVYEGESGGRMWRRDIRTLRDRGLIETDLTTASTPNRKGIKSRLPLKPVRLHLTGREHAAIQQARQVLRPGMPAALPVELPTDHPRREVADLVAILRFLEENGDEVAIKEVADWLQVPDSEAFALLDALTHEDVFTNQQVAIIEFVYDNDEDDYDDDPNPSAVRVFRGRNSAQRPLRGVGLDQLGFFPYSPAETEERLSLIEQALASDELDGSVKHDLRSAETKLMEWRWELRGRKPMS